MALELTPEDFAPDDFVMVRPALVRKMNGNAAYALILGRLNYRCGAQSPGEDGHKWWKCSEAELAEEVGLSEDQVHRAMKKLLAPQVAGEPSTVLIFSRQVNGHDRTKEYRVNLLTSHSAFSRDGNRENAECTPRKRGMEDAFSRNVPSTQTGKTTTRKKTPRARRTVDQIFVEMADAHFDEWYKTYPLRKARPQARTAYEKALEKISTNDERVTSGQDTAVDILLAAALAYKDDVRVKAGYIYNPSTWLNNEHWLDDPTPVVQQGQPRERVEFNGVPVTQRSADALEALQRVREQDEVAQMLAGWDADRALRELEEAPW